MDTEKRIEELINKLADRLNGAVTPTAGLDLSRSIEHLTSALAKLRHDKREEIRLAQAS